MEFFFLIPVKSNVMDWTTAAAMERSQITSPGNKNKYLWVRTRRSIFQDKKKSKALFSLAKKRFLYSPPWHLQKAFIDVWKNHIFKRRQGRSGTWRELPSSFLASCIHTGQNNEQMKFLQQLKWSLSRIILLYF